MVIFDAIRKAHALEFNFELIEKRPNGTLSPNPTVHLGSNYATFNGRAEELLSHPEYIHIYYDKKAQVIGFKPTEDTNGRKASKNSSGFFIAFRGFYKIVDMQPPNKHFTLCEYDGYFIVKLDEIESDGE